MDNTPIPAASQPELKDLQAQCDYLQQLVSSLLLILIVVSGTLTIFLMRQWRFVKSELDVTIPAANQLMMEYTNTYAMTQDFVKKLAEYGRTHTDFAPIMNKYHLNDTLPKAGNSSVTSSLPTSSKQ
jgi:cell division protein FtsL